MIVVQLVGSYMLFFVMLYGYELFVKKYDPALRMPMTEDVTEWNKVAKRSKRKSHLRVVK